jgi:protein-S-isoprenylcysteine O-methyltransferase Ste14
MANQLQPGPEPSVTSLVTGILHDAEDLISQQLNLAKHEFQKELTKTKEGALSLVLGLAVAIVGGTLFFTMFVYLLHEVAGWSLWASFGLVGAIMLGVGLVVTYMGKNKLETVQPVTEETAQSVKENVQWITKPK